MLKKLFGRTHPQDSIAADLYGAIVARARLPSLYADMGVPDTVPGRFEMVLLHTAAVMERLESGSEEEFAVGQRLWDVFCRDMDATLREFGVSDTVMGKRMKKVAESFYGRARAYRTAYKEGGEAGLTEALGRNLYPNEERSADPRLASYVVDLREGLAQIPQGEAIIRIVSWPTTTEGSFDRDG